WFALDASLLLHGSPAGMQQEPLAHLPAVGYHELRIISTTVLELYLVTSKAPDAPPRTWDFAREDGTARLPPATAFSVTADGRRIDVAEVGFKRRVVYAPLKPRELRIGNSVFLR